MIRCITVLAFSVLAVVPASGELLVSRHVGSNNPLSQSTPWTDLPFNTIAASNGPGGSPTGVNTFGPVTVNGVDAWEIDDPLGVPGNVNVQDYSYYTSDTATVNTLTHAWRASFYVQPTQQYDAAGEKTDTSNAAAIQVTTTASTPFTVPTFGLQLGIDSQGRTLIDNPNVAGVDFVGTTGFNWIELIFDPTEGVDLFVNGSLVIDNMAITNTNPAGGAGSGQSRFGDILFFNDGDGGAYWAYAEFATGESIEERLTPIFIPEPTSLAILSLGGFALCRRRCNP